MAPKQKITIYFPEPEESELWEAIQRLPKGVRGMILQDIIRKELLGDPELNLFSASGPTKQVEKPKPVMDEEAALSIPIQEERITAMNKKKTLRDVIGILKTEGEYDFEADRKHAQDYVSINYITSEIKSLKSDYDFPVVILSDVNNRLQNCVEVYDAQQQLEYLKNLIIEGKVEKIK